MSATSIQAVKRWLALVFLVGGFCVTFKGPALAKWEAGLEENPNGESVLSFHELWQNAQGLIPSFGAETDSPAKPQENKNKEDNKSSAGLINAKHLPNSENPVTKTGEKPPGPYRVYSSPFIPDDSSITHSLADPASQNDMPEEFSNRLSDKKDDLEGIVPEPPATGPATIPVTGMSRRFFPILPSNASKDDLPQFIPLSSNRDLTEDQTFVTRAIIVIHDITRNANEALTTITTIAGSENDKTLILAPQFPHNIDVMRFAAFLPDRGRTMARWPVTQSAGWQTGVESLAKPPRRGISSFSVIDLLLLYLADQQIFPSLQTVVVAGHGMGADFVQRYAAVGKASDLLGKQGLSVRFLVANASSYLYFTSVRPSSSASNFTMAKVEECPDVINYPYGLNKPAKYARGSGIDAIRLSYPDRNVMYLLGEAILSDPYLDNDCAALAQGKDRLERGRNYERYLTMSFGGAAQRMQTFAVVSNAGYDPVSLFGSYCGLALLFGDGTCTASRTRR